MRTSTNLIALASLFAVISLFSAGLTAAGAPVAPAPLVATTPLVGALAEPAPHFEAAPGHSSIGEAFVAIVPGHRVLVAPGTVCVAPEGGAGSDVAPASGAPVDVVRFELLGAERSAVALPEQTLIPVSHYLIGNDPADWRRGVAHHAVLRYPDVLPGVDVVHRILDGQVRTDYVLQPGADVRALRLRVKGGDSVRLDEASGDIVVTSAGGEVRYSAPVTFQGVDGAEVPVESRFVRRGSRTFGVKVGAHDRGRPLVVDPTIEYSSYVGPGATTGSIVAKIAIGPDDALYLQFQNAPPAGFPATPGAYQSSTACASAQGVRKYDPTGLQVLWTTYLGSPPPAASACSWFSGSDNFEVDQQGSVWALGKAQAGLPEVNPLMPPPPTGATHAYLARLAPTGDALEFASYLGPASLEFMRFDAAREIYLTGSAAAGYAPLVNPAVLDPLPLHPSFNTFAMKLAPDATSIRQATYVLANARTKALDVDGQGRMLLVSTGNGAWPVVNAPLGWDVAFSSGGSQPTHVARLAADGQSFDFAYYLPFQSATATVLPDGRFVALGNAVRGFPTLNPPAWSGPFPQPPPSTYSDTGFIGMDASGQPEWSALLHAEDGIGIVFQTSSTGRVMFAGSTSTTDMPVVAAFQPQFAGGSSDGILGEMTADGRTLSLLSYIGGGVPATTWGFGADARELVMDVAESPLTGAMWLLTWVGSQDFPTTPDALIGQHPHANQPDPGFPTPNPLAYAITRLSSTSTPRVREPSALDQQPGVRPLTLGSGAAGRLILGWEETNGGVGFNVNVGRLISLRRDRAYDHVPLGPAWCRLPVASADIPLPTEDSYFLVTAVKDTANGYEESSYGRDSLGVERPAVNPADACP